MCEIYIIQSINYIIFKKRHYMKNLEEENEVLKTIIEDLIEMLRDVIQPNYKQFYYNFIVSDK